MTCEGKKDDVAIANRSVQEFVFILSVSLKNKAHSCSIDKYFFKDQILLEGTFRNKIE